jgi:hypothetical protein
MGGCVSGSGICVVGGSVVVGEVVVGVEVLVVVGASVVVVAWGAIVKVKVVSGLRPGSPTAVPVYVPGAVGALVNVAVAFPPAQVSVTVGGVDCSWVNVMVSPSEQSVYVTE